MTRPTDPLFDQRIADWLEDDPLQAPGEVLEIVLAALPSIPRRRASRLPWTFPTMPRLTRFAAAGVIGVLVVVGTLYLIQRGQLAVGGPSPTPGVSSSPSQTASPSTGLSPSAVPARAPSWTATGSMATPGGAFTATLLRDGRVLVAGGGPGGTSAELYDPSTGSWTATGMMVSNGTKATLLLDGRVLVVGGHNAAGGSVTAAQLYDPVSGTWAATGRMTTSRRGFSATLLPDGKVLVAGGERDVKDANPVELASAELYDPASGTWTATGSMLATRFDHSATLLPDGRVLVAGGGGLATGATICCDPLPSAELYDPASGTWTSAGKMTAGRVRPTATVLLDGRVLVAGGGTATAELYDPGTGFWTATPAMVTTAVIDFSATLLADGNVLVAGGWDLHVDANESATSVTSAELYDTATGTWTDTLSMTTARMGHTATLLPDGRVLVTGGLGAGNGTAELYDPGSGQ